MPISHKHKIIFVHIPKTAGTTIEDMLDIKVWDKNILRSEKSIQYRYVKYTPQHFTCEMLISNEISSKYWDDYFNFSVVRNPYSRVMSEYSWVKRKKIKHSFDLNEFKTWMYKYYKKIDKDHKVSQYDYLYHNDVCLVDYVGKFEAIGSVFDKLKDMGVDKSITHHHKSKTISDINLLDQESKDFIYLLYKKDFEYFNYKQ